jgi:hypothetical protein
MDKKRIPIDEDRFYELITIKVIFSEIRKAYLESKNSEDLGEDVIEIMESYSDYFTTK